MCTVLYSKMKLLSLYWFAVFTTNLFALRTCAPTPSKNYQQYDSTHQYDVLVQKQTLEKIDSPTGGKVCTFEGRLFPHGAQVPRSDPCETCRCLLGEVFCWKTSCVDTKPRPECQLVHVQGICCSIHKCPESKSTKLLNTEITTNSSIEGSASTIKRSTDLSRISTVSLISPTVPVSSTLKTASATKVCDVNGENFPEGDLIPSSSGPCIECRCGSQGQIDCKPLDCKISDPVVTRTFIKLQEH
ncbi:von Willebrand factor C and EGF domain-containing protein-like [Limulus polyphemus]|uniref:von Willebrand factor C and EGF domain-containing protein-like n=1 Tax=Limulus polyphemus TaxID=6850 RepID=A0ABM1T536_LIMPO|nr:von Willebrand factor C and EGF domain-containing protein-like [Limulus polyphemus]